ncbi:MAG: DUF1501 domain-containing protein [Pseudomonadota bacterium]
MKRRELLSILGLSSLVGLTPSMWPKFAEAATPSNRLWIIVRASGGWDPVSFCNPHAKDYTITDSKGVTTSRGPMSHYPESFVETLGGIRYAPGITASAERSYGTFVEKYYQELLVINGIEMNTNDHDTGSRLSLSGSGGLEHPAFAAYAAASINKSLPLSFLTASGYSNTAGLTSKVNVQGVNNLSKVTEPNLLTNNKEVFSKELFERLELESLQRIERQSSQSTLPRQISELKSFYDAQLSSVELKLLKEKMPITLEQNGRFSAIQYICAAMAANLTVSGQLSLGGSWDTHDSHDVNAGYCLKYMVEGLDFLCQEAARQGILDRLNIMVTSDFGRTPYYNSDNGKDHWTVGSMLFMGPDFDGNRMINATNSNAHAIKMNLNTMVPDENGEKITAKMIHKTLRAITGTVDSPMDRKIPIDAPIAPKLFKV